MRTAVYYSNNDVRVEEMPVPEIGAGEILLRVRASGICGSDVMEWYRKDKVPLVLGHEVAGEIAAVGKGVENYKEGDRVCVAHHVPCNTCHYCLTGHHTACETLRKTNFYPGGFAEYLRVPAINVDRGVFKIPDSVSFEEATFTEPLACVLRGMRKAGVYPGCTILVTGSGISGLLYIHLSRIFGASRILATDVSEYRLNAARKFGADLAIHASEDIPRRVREANEGRLADIVVICTGAQSAIMSALKCVDRGGTVLFFAPTDRGVTIPLSINEIFWRNDVTLTTSYAGSPADYDAALKLISTGRLRLKEMITHRLPLEESQKGFQLVANAQESMKVIIEPA
jgi:L-iditol 2-dehydrogenase